MTNLPQKSNRKIYTSLLLATATVFLVAQPGMGFLLVVLLIPLLIWLSYSAYGMLRWPETRRNRLLRVTIWLVALALMVGIHYWRHTTTRQHADGIVATIQRHAAKQGQYPATLAAAGIPSQGVWLRYRCDQGKPSLYYRGTFLPFESYQYDFSVGAWEHLAD